MTAPVAVAAERQIVKKQAAKHAENKAAGKHRAMTSPAASNEGRHHKTSEAGRHRAPETAPPESPADRSPGKSLNSGGVAKQLPGVKRYRQVLALEIVAGSVLIMGQINTSKTVNDILIQEAAFLIVFLILSGMTVAGSEIGRMSAALGGLIILSLALTRTKWISAPKASQGPGYYNNGQAPVPQPSPPVQVIPRPPGWQGDWPPSGVNPSPPNSI